MFRSFFIFLSKAEWAKKLIMSMRLTRNMAHRFIAGETLNEAMQVVRELNQKGINATFDHLGESTRSHEQARQATQDILQMLDMLEQEQARSNVSIKLTQIGLALDEAFCAENLRQILTYARERHNFVRIDMEDSPTVDATLRIYWQMRQKHGLDNTGLVIQSYLYRSEADVRALMEAQTTIRLCKGAYKEPPEVAFPKKLDVDANFDRSTRILMDTAKAHPEKRLSADGRIPPIPAIATHDEQRVEYALAYARQIGLEPDSYEFQMLHGIRRDLQEQLVQQGFRVRVYVPWGTQWYPYFMRRLAERPANVWFLLSNLLRR
jgi:proline dehydrogenase